MTRPKTWLSERRIAETKNTIPPVKTRSSIIWRRRDRSSDFPEGKQLGATIQQSTRSWSGSTSTAGNSMRTCCPHIPRVMSAERIRSRLLSHSLSLSISPLPRRRGRHRHPIELYATAYPLSLIGTRLVRVFCLFFFSSYSLLLLPLRARAHAPTVNCPLRR
jgi:hypothetical protein